MDYEKNLLKALANIISSQEGISKYWQSYRSKLNRAHEYIDYLSTKKQLISELELSELEDNQNSVEVSRGVFLILSKQEKDQLDSIRKVAMRDYQAFKYDISKLSEKFAVPKDLQSALMFAVESNLDNKIMEGAVSNNSSLKEKQRIIFDAVSA